MARQINDVIALHDYQKEHVENLSTILQIHGVAFDLSPTGLGKTYTACKVASRLNKPIFVIGPASVLSKWKEVTTKYNIQHIELLSYEKIRRNNKWVISDMPKHQVTQEFLDIIHAGALVIFDEAHKLKNKSITNAACHAIANAVKDEYNSKLLLMSATLLDKSQQLVNMFNVTGFSDDAPCARMQEICRQWAAGDQKQFLSDGKGNRNTFDLCFTNIFIPKLSSTMRAPVNAFSNNIAFLYLNMEGDLLAEYMKNIRDLLEVLNNPFYDCNRLAKLNKLMQEMQMCKVHGMVNYTKEVLERKNTKVVLFCDYHRVMELLVEELADYNPSVINGTVLKSQRDAIYESFQADSDKTRLLITSLSVSGQGIDLHDVHGTYPRWAFMMPNFRAIDILQASGRIFRNGSRSNANVRILFASSDEPVDGQPNFSKDYDRDNVEGKVFENIWGKGAFCKSIMAEQAANGVKFICDYGDVSEEGARSFKNRNAVVVRIETNDE